MSTWSIGQLAKRAGVAIDTVRYYERNGLLAPAGTPPAVIARLNAAAKKAVQTEVFKKRLESEGLVISAGSPEEFDRYLKEEEVRWRKVVKAANITAD